MFESAEQEARRRGCLKPSRICSCASVSAQRKVTEMEQAVSIRLALAHEQSMLESLQWRASPASQRWCHDPTAVLRWTACSSSRTSGSAASVDDSSSRWPMSPVRERLAFCTLLAIFTRKGSMSPVVSARWGWSTLGLALALTCGASYNTRQTFRLPWAYSNVPINLRYAYWCEATYDNER